MGALHLLHQNDKTDHDHDRIFSVEDWRHAIDLTRHQIECFQRRIHCRIEESVAQIFRTHLAILDDKKLTALIEDGIHDGRPAVQVIRDVFGRQIEMFSQSEVERIREKVQDLQDIAHRLVRNLNGRNQSQSGLAGHIVVAREIYPSDLLRLVAQDAAGAILVGCGATAHINILARSLQLPMVVCEVSAIDLLRTGMVALLDGGRGRLTVSSSPGVLPQYSLQPAGAVSAAQRLPSVTTTADGCSIRLLANVGLISESKEAQEIGADGIGLYRSEIPFLLCDHPPNEDEQVSIYRRVLEHASGGEATLRLLDLGGDKIPGYFPDHAGPNPSLGLRGIQFAFRHPEVLASQVRAILRAGIGRPLRILVPMVSSIDCFRKVRSVIEACLSDLAEAGIPHHATPALGAMIESCSAVLLVHEIAREADFLAIGSNDLVQYILGVDRGDDQVADCYIPWHPAVLRALRQIVDASLVVDRPLSICGDIACDPVLMPVLFGMGITAFSVPPRTLGRVHEAFSRMRRVEASALAERVLACATIAEVEDVLGLSTSRA